MKKYVLKRLAQLVIVILGVSFMTYMLLLAAPSDAAEMRFEGMNTTPTPEMLEEARQELGLYDPFIVQYLRWLNRTLHGDLGMSTAHKVNVLPYITRRLPETIKLAGAAGLLMLLISFPAGILSAMRRNKKEDYVIRAGTFLGISMPDFWFGLILMYVFAVKLRWFSVLHTDAPNAIVLPMLTLAVPMSASYIRYIRTAILEEYNSEYVTGALARGIPEWRIMLKDVLPNAMIPIVTMFGLSVGGLLGGATVIETLFSWDGIGNMAVTAIRMRDYPVIQAYVIWMGLIYVTVNFIVDISYRLLDPQIRLSTKVE